MYSKKMLSAKHSGIIFVVLFLICRVGALPKSDKQQNENVLQSANTQNVRGDSLKENEIHPHTNNEPPKDSGLSCHDLTPHYARINNIQPQSSPSPFTINVDPDLLEPGDTAKVTITTKSGQGKKLKGFALQVVNLSALRDINNSTVRTVGDFLRAENTNLQTCHTEDDTLIYTGPEVDDRIQFEWKSQNGADGSVAIRGTFVAPSGEYWMNVFSNRFSVQPSEITNSDSSRSQSDELRDAVSETLENVRGPMENMEEVLIHQGVRTVQKIDNGNGGDGTPSNGADAFGVRVVPNELDNEVAVDDSDIPETDKEPTFIYSEMNNNPQEFERPQTAEFLGTLMNMAGGGGGGGGGLSSMMNLMKGASTVSKLFGGSKRSQPPPPPSRGGGLLGSLLGGGAPSPSPSPAGGLLGSLLGGGGAASSNSGGGGLGGLGSLLGNLAPPPTGLPPSRGPVTITPTDEPSLADLLGVDPSTVIDTAPQAAPSRNNPLASLLGGGSSGGSGGGGLGSLLGGGGRSGGGGGLGNLATLASLAGPLSGLLGGGSKSRNTPPPLPGFGGSPGMGGMSGMGGFGNNMFGAGGGSNPFGFGGFSQTPSMDQIMGMMQQQQAQITALQNQISGNSIPNRMGGFGNIPLNFGQQANAQLLGIPGQSPGIRNPTPFGQFNPMQRNNLPQNNFGMNRPQGNFGNNQFQRPNNFGNNQFQQPNQFNQNNQFRNNQFRQPNNNQFGNQFGQQPNNNFGQNQFGQNNQNQGGNSDSILMELVKQNRLLMEQLQTMRSPNTPPPNNNFNQNQQNQWQNNNNNNNVPQNNAPNTNGNLFFNGQQNQNQNPFSNNGGNNQGSPGNFPPTSNGNSPPFGSTNGNSLFNNNNGGQNNNPSNFPFNGQNGAGNQGNSNNQNNFPSGPSNDNNLFSNNNNNNNNNNNFPASNNNLFGQNSGNNFNNNNNNGNQPQNPFGGNDNGNFENEPSNPFGGGNDNQQNPFGPQNNGGSDAGSSNPFGMFGPESSNSGGGGAGSSLADMFGGGGGGNTLSSQLGSMLGGAGGGTGNNPLAGLLGGGSSNSPGGASDISNLMKNVDTSAIGNLLGQMGSGPGGTAGGNMDLNSLLGGADINKMQNALSGGEGQDLMSSINGLLGGPGGAGLMDAMNGMMSGDANALSNIENILSGSNPADLQNMAQQAESLLSSSGIDPGQLIAQVMG